MLHRILLVLSLLCSIHFANPLYAQSYLELELPLLVNNAFIGNINLNIDIESENPDNALIPIDRLTSLIDEFTSAEQNIIWFGGTDDMVTDASISLIELQERGFDIHYDPALLTINADVPRTGLQRLSLRANRRPDLDSHYSESEFASGLSLLLRNSFRHKSLGISQTGFGDNTLEVRGFTSIGGFDGWSLFYEGEYEENSDQKFTRKDVTLFHNNFESGLRYAIGDINPTRSRFQSTTNMLGIGVERDYQEINPFRNLRPSGQSTFTLESPSRVTFEVNGVVIGTESLDAGNYSLEDFPLTSGSNDVRIFVDNGTSVSEIADFSTYVDTTLLANGISNYGINVGLPRKLSIGQQGREYEQEPAIVGFYEKGVRENLTLGSHFEAREDHALLSMNIIYANKLGVFAFENAFSKRTESDTGIAALVRYAFQGISSKNWFMQHDVQFNYRSNDFYSLSDSSARPEEWSINARSSFNRAGLSVTLGGEVREIDDLKSNRISLALSKAFSSFAVSLGYQYSQSDSPNGSNGSKITLNFSKRLGDSRVRSQYSSAPQQTRVEWRNNSSRNVGDIRAKVGAAKNLDSNDAEIDLGYINSRFEFDLRHFTTKSTTAIGNDFSVSNVSLGAGIAYADGQIAFGRPFSKGFMILDRHKSLDGKKISVLRNSAGGDAVTSVKNIGNVLVPLGNSYRSERFLFSVDDLPIGYDIGEGGVKLFPGQYAGFKYQIGSDAANTVIGTLLSPDETPIELMSGKLISLDKKDSEPILFFTNRTGRFVAEKMSFGEYQIVIDTGEDILTADLTVSESKEFGLVQAGTLILETE